MIISNTHAELLKSQELHSQDTQSIRIEKFKKILPSQIQENFPTIQSPFQIGQSSLQLGTLLP